MCILLEHANHKELLTSTNNGVKTLEITVIAFKWESRCCITTDILVFEIYTKRYTNLEKML